MIHEKPWTTRQPIISHARGFLFHSTLQPAVGLACIIQLTCLAQKYNLLLNIQVFPVLAFCGAEDFIEDNPPI
jgi:hypothetical protein